MKKVNIEELTKKLNEFRMSSLMKTFIASDLRQKLTEIGFTTNIASSIMQRCFPFEKMGKSRLYGVPKDPIHKSIVASAYKKQTTYGKRVSEKEALEFLIQKGYQIRRCVGFDMERFKKEQPTMYQKYLRYECI